MASGTIETENASGPKADPAALIREHQAGVWRYVRFLGATQPEADDLVQETFFMVLRKPFEVRSHKETAAYLRTAAKRQLLMLRRSQQKENSLAIPLSELPLADKAWAEAAGEDGLESYLDALRDCLNNGITDRVKLAFRMQYEEKSTRQQVAAKLEMTVDGVKTLVRRAKATLRTCIERKINHD